MSLSDAKVRNAKPRLKPYKIYDGEGMFLFVTVTGVKSWRLKYRFAGKEKLLALGIYPDIGLGEARERSAQVRKILAAGDDPALVKREGKRTALIKAANSFEKIAREWFENRKHQWVPSTSETIIKRLERHVFPRIGIRPIAEINASQVLEMLRIIEHGGALEMARRVKQICGQVFMYAIVTGRAERNPVPDLLGALKTPVKKHFAHLDAVDLPDFLKKLEAYDGALQTRLALRFLMLTFVRTTELRAAEWTEIDFDRAEWRIPSNRMKMKEPHIVPLSTQSIEVLRELQIQTGNRQYIFAHRNKIQFFMSENTMLYALYRMGYHSRTTGHGFRSTASTILNENGFMPDMIERQLGHSERNKVRAAYNHAQYLPDRRKMMQWWADYLDEAAKKSAKPKN